MAASAVPCLRSKDKTMQKIGTVDRIRQGNFCFIKTPGEPDHFAHWTDFKDPKKDMEIGKRVYFTPLALKKTKNPRATHIIAA